MVPFRPSFARGGRFYIGVSAFQFTRVSTYEKALGSLLDNKDLCLINVNLPANPKGLKWTRQSVRQYDGKVVAGNDPMGRKHYWFTVIPLEPAEEGTDRWAVENGYVSITPLRLDLTNEDELRKAVQEEPVPGK